MIRDILKENEGKIKRVRGWVYRHRILGENKVFIVLRDSTDILQCIVKKDSVSEKTWNNAINLYIESSVLIEGTVKKDERAPGGVELKVKDIEPICVGFPFPIQKDLSKEFLLDVRHLWLRSRKMQAIMKARHHIINYLREFLNNKGFYEITPPLLTKAGTEGGSDMFEINYFGKKAYLTQSSQLYGEVMIFSLEKVYTLAPCFRAEKSRTKKHLTEFWMLEPEMAFYDQEMNMKLQEELVRYVIKKMVNEHKDLFQMLNKDPEIHKNIDNKFPRLVYEKAIEKVNELGGKMNYGDDFGADEEALLTSIYDIPIFVTNFPKSIKPFYMREDEKRIETVLNDDLLAPKGHGEIIGGSERIWKYDKLINRMKELNMKLEDYEWYLDLRKYGSIPHSGFGLGIERFIKYILDLDHIRDTIPFPRTITRLEP